MSYDWHDFSARLRELCEEYCDIENPEPPCTDISSSRMNALLAGSRKPTEEELICISKSFNVSINYLLTGDELFPSLHGLKKKDANRLLEEIQSLES